MDTSIGTVIAEKIKDFAEEGIPEVFDRDLSLGRIQPPARGNLVNVIVGVRRCGKTYRLYQEMHRIVAEGYPQDSILYFNFEDERLKPYEKELLQEVIEVFYARNPRARQEGAFFFFDEIQEVPDWGLFLRRMVDTYKATIYATGSSSKMLSTEVASEFRGRALPRELFPLAFPNSFAIRGMRRLLRTTPLLPSALSQATCARICDTTAASTWAGAASSPSRVWNRPMRRCCCRSTRTAR